MKYCYNKKAGWFSGASRPLAICAPGPRPWCYADTLFLDLGSDFVNKLLYLLLLGTFADAVFF